MAMHRLIVKTPGAGDPVEDPEGGIYQPADPVVVYDGPADVLDGGEALIHGQEVTTVQSDAEAFLEIEDSARLISSGMSAEIIWNPDTGADDISDAVVDSIVRLTNSVRLKYV